MALQTYVVGDIPYNSLTAVRGSRPLNITVCVDCVYSQLYFYKLYFDSYFVTSPLTTYGYMGSIDDDIDPAPS